MQEAMRGLAQQITTAYEARAADLASLRSRVSALQDSAHVFLSGLAEARRDLAQGLHRDLAKNRTALKAEALHLQSQAKTALHQIERDAARRRSETRQWLKEGTLTRQQAAQRRRHALARGRAALHQAAEQSRGHARRWLGQIAKGRSAAHQEWLQMEVILQGKRSNGRPAKAPAPPGPGGTPAATAQETPGKAGASELRERVLQYLSARAGGTRLAELEQEFGLSRFQAARLVRSLLEEGKTEKRDRLYFRAQAQASLTERS